MSDDLNEVLGVTPALNDAEEAEVAMLMALHADDKPAPGWRIRNLAQADWVMQRVSDLETRAREYQDEVARWTDALRRATAVHGWLVEQLQAWALAQRTESRKTFPLAHGTVSTRAGRPRVIVVDENAAVTWARAHAPEATEVTVKLVKSRLPGRIVGDRWVSPDGEVVPGIVVELGEPTATVTPLGA